jgi:hypothetical protein
MSILGIASLILAALPFAMICRNLALYRKPINATQPGVHAPGPAHPAVSVLIPARDEAANIEACIQSVLDAAEGVELELIVLDDHSTDDTAAIVSRLSQADPRIRLEHAPDLPQGWVGKQHACWVLAQRATHDTLIWIDADVRLAPGSFPGSLHALAQQLATGEAKLISGVPRQITGSAMERLIVPQVLLVLLGYLPIDRMRQSTQPGLGAGCGQLFVADRKAYFETGGHEQIKWTMHDGVALPRLFRRHNFLTDLFDATETATCRMYEGTSATWRGFMKNATEGMASPIAIVPWTVLLIGGHVLPWVLIACGVLTWPVLIACGLSLAMSVALALRFKQGIYAAVLRPIGVMLLVMLQWQALFNRLRGKQPTWRGRAITD